MAPFPRQQNYSSTLKVFSVGKSHAIKSSLAVLKLYRFIHLIARDAKPKRVVKEKYVLEASFEMLFLT